MMYFNVQSKNNKKAKSVIPASLVPKPEKVNIEMEESARLLDKYSTESIAERVKIAQGLFKTVEQLRNFKQLDYNPSPYTDPKLCQQVFNKVLSSKKHKSIGIAWTIEMAILLWTQGRKNVTVFTDKKCSRTQWIVETLLNYKYLTIKEIKYMGMKFDVIVGNPPYNGTMGDNRSQSKNTNNSNLYLDFILKSIEMKPKFISLIVPAGWMQKKEIIEKALDAGLKKVKEIDLAYFPGVSIRSGISMLHIESGYQGKIEIESLTSSFKIDRDDVISFDNPKKFKIIEKLKHNKMFDTLLSYGPYKVPTGTKGSTERLIKLDPNYSETQDKKHSTPVMIYAGGSVADPRYLYHTNNYAQQNWGVVVPSASDKHIIGAVRLVEPGVGVSDKLKVVYFNTKDEALNAKQFLESRLISFVIRTTKHNDTVNTNKNSFGNIPIIDFTKPFDEKNLLQQFNFSQEELDVIN